jgi:hypothetical protein
VAADRIRGGAATSDSRGRGAGGPLLACRVRLHFERVAIHGSCDIRLEVRAGVDDAEVRTDVPLERDVLP